MADMLPPEELFDVFLSHSHVDAEVVEALAVRLEDESNFRVWLDRWVLVPGEHWQQMIARALDQARTCAVCIGDRTPQGWFGEEVQRALNRQVRDPSFRVIPVLLPNSSTVNVDEFLELRTWVDFRNGTEDPTAFHHLVSGIQGTAPGRGPRGAEPADRLQEQIVEELRNLQQLRNLGLIEEIIYREAQRKVLEKVIRPLPTARGIQP
jgi:hypothetical protein